MSWQSDVVDRLVELKASGHVDFDQAWTAALRMFPPRNRDVGEWRPQLWSTAEETVVEFFRRVCEDAWHGRNPRLRHFSPAALIEVDASGPAGRTRSRIAA